MSRWWTIGVVILLSLAASLAHAQDVSTVELGAWPETVAALESDVGAQGRSVSVCVREERSCLPCGRYTVALDAAGTQAFSIGACDARTGTTALTLVDRSALFDHAHAIPRPRTIALHAAIVHDLVSSGGAATTGGSALGCTAEVRPFLRDLEHGTVVYLGPDAYELRARHVAVSIAARDRGWLLTTETRIATSVDYDVVERASGETVLSGHAALECAQETSTGATRSRASGSATPSAPAHPTGEIRIRSDLPARVFVDGVERGVTPLELRLDEGQHEVRVVDAAALAQQRIVPVAFGRRTTVVCRFRPDVRRDALAYIARSADEAPPAPVFDPWRSDGHAAGGVETRCDVDDPKIGVGHDAAGACVGLAPRDEAFVFEIRRRTTFHAELLNEFGGGIVLRTASGRVWTLADAHTAELHGTASIHRTLEPGRYSISIETPDGEAGRYRLAWSLRRRHPSR